MWPLHSKGQKFNEIWNLTYEGTYILLYTWLILILRVSFSTRHNILSFKHILSVLSSLCNQNCRQSTVTKMYISKLYRCTHVSSLFCMINLHSVPKSRNMSLSVKVFQKKCQKRHQFNVPRKLCVCMYVPDLILATNVLLINSIFF